MTLTIEKFLMASFKQPDGDSMPGIDWMVRINDVSSQFVIVRTYLESSPLSEKDRVELGDAVLNFLKRKIELGWRPSTASGVLEMTEPLR